MRTELKKSLVGGLMVALAATALAAQAAPGKSKGSGGWESSADHFESAVISIKSGPVREQQVEDEVIWVADEAATEAACVAVQIGMNLLMSEFRTCPPEREVTATVTPADEVVLFLTLEGVRAVGSEIGSVEPAPMCRTPCGPAPLVNLIAAFDNMPGSDVMICPLCWNMRYGPCKPDGTDCPSVGFVGNSVELHDLFLDADKVIDF